MNKLFSLTLSSVALSFCVYAEAQNSQCKIDCQSKVCSTNAKEKIEKTVSKGVFRISPVNASGGNAGCAGIAFLVDDKLLLTARHVLTCAGKLQTLPEKVSVYAGSNLDDDADLRANVLKNLVAGGDTSTSDIALLKFTADSWSSVKHQVKKVSFAPNEQLCDQQEVATFYSSPHQSGRRWEAAPSWFTFRKHQDKLLVLEERLRVGFSGSPVLSCSGDVVGMVLQQNEEHTDAYDTRALLPFIIDRSIFLNARRPALDINRCHLNLSLTSLEKGIDSLFTSLRRMKRDILTSLDWDVTVERRKSNDQYEFIVDVTYLRFLMQTRPKTITLDLCLTDRRISDSEEDTILSDGEIPCERQRLNAPGYVQITKEPTPKETVSGKGDSGTAEIKLSVSEDAILKHRIARQDGQTIKDDLSNLEKIYVKITPTIDLGAEGVATDTVVAVCSMGALDRNAEQQQRPAVSCAISGQQIY